MKTHQTVYGGQGRWGRVAYDACMPPI